MSAGDLRAGLPTRPITVPAFRALPDRTGEPITEWVVGAVWRRDLTPSAETPQWVIVECTGAGAVQWYRPVLAES